IRTAAIRKQSRRAIVSLIYSIKLPRLDNTIILVRLPPLGGEGWGGGIRCVGFQVDECEFNLLDNRTDILIQFLVSKSDHAVVARGEPGSAPLVVLDGFGVQTLGAIELDDELVCEANKIHDIRADRGLTAKLPPAQLLNAKEVP